MTNIQGTHLHQLVCTFFFTRDYKLCICLEIKRFVLNKLYWYEIDMFSPKRDLYMISTSSLFECVMFLLICFPL